LSLRQPPRIGELQVDLAVALQFRHIAGRGDEDLEKGIAFRSRPHVDGLEPAGTLLLQHPEILDDFVPAGHLLVGAELEPEEFFRRRDLLRRRNSGHKQNRQQAPA